jgi:dsDNA-binding SOS-regulon protein
LIAKQLVKASGCGTKQLFSNQLVSIRCTKVESRRLGRYTAAPRNPLRRTQACRAPTQLPKAQTMIEIEYIVKDQNGVERLRTTDKKAADAYDKALENADRLAQLLRDDKVLPNLADADLEELTIYLARNAKNVERVLRGKSPEPSKTDSALDENDNIAPLKAAS